MHTEAELAEGTTDPTVVQVLQPGYRMGERVLRAGAGRGRRPGMTAGRAQGRSRQRRWDGLDGWDRQHRQDRQHR